MEQQFILKEYAGYTIFEQNQMTSEERLWILKRLEKKNEQEQDAAKKATAGR
jgi:hypothetical protein